MIRNKERVYIKNKYSCLRWAFIFVLYVLSFPELNAQIISGHGSSISLYNNAFIVSKDLNNNLGQIFNNGNINLSGSYMSTGQSQGNGFYRIGGNWIHTGIFLPSLSSVIFNGSVSQFVTHPSIEFYNFSIFNTGVAAANKIILNNNIAINNFLGMESGVIDAGTFKISLISLTSNSLNYTSTTGSRVLGRFERGLGEEQKKYLFPLGTETTYNPLNLVPNLINVPGTIISRFILSDPGNVGLPLADPPVEIISPFTDGYWDLRSTGFSSPDYNIDITGTGFSEPVTSVTRVITRETGGDWTVDGDHAEPDTIQGIAKRNELQNDISLAGTQVAFGRARPLIVKQIRDTIVCEDTDPVFDVDATGARTLRYTWYKVGSPDIQILNSDPAYSGARTSALTVLNVQLDDAGQYYCIITDRYGNSVRTRNAVLIVNKIPVATATPGSQDHECTDIPFSEILLGESYGVPGTTYLWSRSNPAGLQTDLPLSGTIDLIGGVIPDYSVENITDEPLTITFTIIPVGPEPTLCTGLPVTATVTVNPVPRAIPVNNLPEICDLGTNNIVLTTPTVMTSGNIRFDYTVSHTGGSDLTGNMLPGSDLLPGHTISYAYGNSSSSIQTVSYFITPKVDNAVCPPGLVAETNVGVHANPIQGITELQPLTCDDPSGLGALRVDIPTGAEPYSVEWTGRDNYYNDEDFSIYGLKEGTYYVTVRDNLGCTDNAVKPLYAAFAEPFIYAMPYNPGGQHVTCRDSSDARIMISVSGGITEPYTYQFLKNGVVIDDGIFLHNRETDPSAYLIIEDLSAGTYTLRIADRNNCKRERSINIKVPPAITSTFVTKDVSCKGYSNGSIKATVAGGRGGPYIYEWSTPDGYIPGPVNSREITNISRGTYHLMVKDVLGCPAYFTVQVGEPDGMELVSVDAKNISCNGYSDGSLKMKIQGGTGVYSYLWTGPGGYTSTAESISGLYPGTYTCIVTDQNGCMLNSSPGVIPSFTLTQPSPVEITAVTSSAPFGGFNIGCYGGTGSIDLTVTGGSGNYSFDWSTSDGAGIVTGMEDQSALKAGIYHIKVVDENGCYATRDVLLTQPGKLVLDITATNVTCISPDMSNGAIDLAVSGGTGSYSYLWSNGAITEDISDLAAGVYNVTVHDMNSCSKSASATIHLPPALKYSVKTSSYNSYEVSCYGLADGQIVVTPESGDAPFTYSLSGPSGYLSVNSTGSFMNLKAGTYVLVITDANYCSSTETINMREPGRLEARYEVSQSTFGGFNLNCAGDKSGSITINPFNSVNNVEFLWSDGFHGRTRSELDAGLYKVIIIDDNYCQAEATINLTQPDTVRLALRVNPPFCPDKPDGSVTARITGGIPGMHYDYLWSDNSSEDRLINITGGYYTLKVTDMNGCVVKDSVTVIPENETCLIIPNIISPNGDLINDHWNIGMKELYPEMVITIFNRWGEPVWRSERGYPLPWNGKNRGQVLPMDSYHYIIDLNNGSEPIIGNITIVK